MITLYHGSNTKVTHIALSQCNPYKDFGQAFYLTFCTLCAIEQLKYDECK